MWVAPAIAAVTAARSPNAIVPGLPSRLVPVTRQPSPRSRDASAWAE